MKALLYLDASMISGKFLNGLGRILGKDMQNNLLSVTWSVIAPYPAMNLLAQDVSRGRTLLGETKTHFVHDSRTGRAIRIFVEIQPGQRQWIR